MITSRFKNFLFHCLAYLFINIGFYIGMMIASIFLYTYPFYNYGSGSNSFGLAFAIMILFGQIFAGLIIAILFSLIKKRINFLIQIGIFILTNLPAFLCFVYLNESGLYYIYMYITGGFLILGSLIYSFLLRKYFSK